jgi:hypothetical protein
LFIHISKYLWHFYCFSIIQEKYLFSTWKGNNKNFWRCNMNFSKLKIIFCLIVCLTILFAPFLLEIFQDGKSYAFSSRSGNKSSKTGDGSSFTGGYTIEPGDDPPPVHPIPEPATLLLLGAGAAGLAAIKKFKKK